MEMLQNTVPDKLHLYLVVLYHIPDTILLMNS